MKNPEIKLPNNYNIPFVLRGITSSLSQKEA
jgi:hypothetical protein